MAGRRRIVAKSGTVLDAWAGRKPAIPESRPEVIRDDALAALLETVEADAGSGPGRPRSGPNGTGCP